MHRISIKFMVLLLLACSTLKSSNVNYGDVISGNIEIIDNLVVNNGDYCALKNLSIRADSFEGAGNIYAQSATINCKKFAFTGTIACFNKCVINAEEPFDETMFTHDGPGEFIITIGKDVQSNQNMVNSESISFEPLKKYLMKFPTNHPFKTVTYCTIAAVGLAVYIHAKLRG